MTDRSFKFSLKSVGYSYDAVASDPQARDGNAIECRNQSLFIDSLDIEDSGVTAIIGPSGSGKTTLLSLLAGFLKPDIDSGGHFKFSGRPLDATGYRPGDLAFVFQSPMLLGPANGYINMFQGHAARQNVRASEIDIANLRKLTAKLGLLNNDRSLLDRKSRKLSGGEAQRLAVLRALLTDAETVLCDEPTSSLDEKNAAQVMEALVDWSKTRARPVVWVTHKLEQAAEFADHFIFVSQGRIVRPTAECLAQLQSLRGQERVKVLQSIARQLYGDFDGPRGVSGNPLAKKHNSDSETPAGGFAVQRGDFNTWVAQALSSDGREEQRDHGALVPASLRGLMNKIDPGFNSGMSWPTRIANRVISYSRIGLFLVLLTLFFQIYFALMLQKTASVYSSVRLQDPAVARIVFEHHADNLLSPDAEKLGDLFQNSTIPELTEKIRAAFVWPANEAARTKVQVFGRRPVAGSAIKLPGKTGVCGSWIPIEVVALNHQDPLLMQTVLSHETGQISDMAALIDAVQRSIKQSGGSGIAVLESRSAGIITRKCGIDFSAGAPIDWAVGNDVRDEPLRLDISGIAIEMPPLHPYTLQMLVFENDYQQAANLRDGEPPGSFPMATAYFPLDGVGLVSKENASRDTHVGMPAPGAFETVENVIEQNGYVIRGDSRAAVETLQQVDRIAGFLPTLIKWINGIGIVVVVMIVIEAILELNRRVLTLFRAYGFSLRDCLSILGLHLLPAVAGALIVMISGVFATWRYVIPFVPSELGPLESYRNSALLSAGFFGAALVGVAVLLAVTTWWWHTKSHMTKYLKE